jgi:uncharacterized protein YbjT (DUF2867 family)
MDVQNPVPSGGSGPPAGHPPRPARLVFVAGGTGYVGSRLVRALLDRGHRVRCLARAASAGRLPSSAEVVLGDALDASSYASSIAPADTFVHLVGVPHPSPAKARQFVDIDLRAATEAAGAAASAGIGHFVFISVARPAPVMKAYQQARERAEAAITATGVPATFLRPWYILGPGHWWPVALLPLYWIAERVPATRDAALRLGLLRREAVVHALVGAVEHPPASAIRAVGVAEMRRAAATAEVPPESEGSRAG